MIINYPSDFSQELYYCLIYNNIYTLKPNCLHGLQLQEDENNRGPKKITYLLGQ